MTLDLVSIPLAAAAGVLGVLSPCVWPLVPVVVASAATAGSAGPWLLAAGLALAFAVAGTLLSFLLVSAGLDPEALRSLSGALLVGVGLALAWRPLGALVSGALSRLTGRLGAAGPAGAGAWTQFGVGCLLGLVWLPCVGPTLGAAIGLASMGRSLALAFAAMLAHGAGTGAVLLAAGLASRRALASWRPRALELGGRGRTLFGGVVLMLGLLVVSGLDRRLEALAVAWVPEWVLAL